MGWWIVLVVSVGLMVLAWLVTKWNDDLIVTQVLLGTFAMLGIIISSMVIIFTPIKNKQELYKFKAMTEYYQTHSADNKLEDVSITQKKVELNEWLAESKFMKIEYPFWSFIPDEVLDLKPIE